VFTNEAAADAGEGKWGLNTYGKGALSTGERFSAEYQRSETVVGGRFMSS